VTDDDTLPTNAGNPSDLITLINWATRNLPRWEQLDNNSDTMEVAAGQDYVYQQHNGGKIWRYNAATWDNIDNNCDTVEIAAGGQAYLSTTQQWQNLAVQR